MELTQTSSTALSEIKTRLDAAKYDPTMLIKAALDTVEQVTNGEVILVDASNPAVMLLEMAAVQTANAVQENIVLLRRQYSSLAMEEDELYLHMSDEDYLNRFSVPVAPVEFTFVISMNDFLRDAVYDATEKSYKLIIQRDTTINVDGVIFSLLYPVVLRRYENGVIQISYDASITNPLHTLKNTIIAPTIRAGSNQEKWLFFNVDGIQVEDSTSYFTIDKTQYFQKEIQFSDNYYYARAFYKNSNTNGSWVEIRTTHTDQVFDPAIPTALLRVETGVLIVEIPVIYTSKETITGEIRVDVYTTKGDINLNLANFRQDSFVTTLRAIDEERDTNQYTVAMSTVSFYVYSLATVLNGVDGLSFDALRDRVIYNSIGPQNLPITNVQLTAEAENNGFDIVREVDVLTNRIFLATQKLPTPAQKKLITPANIGIVPYTTDLTDLTDHYKARFNQDRVTILSKAFWRNTNGVLTILTKNDIEQLQALGQTAMVSKINDEQYFYTPFYYVLDMAGEEYEVRAYSLDQPYGLNHNFVSQNQTLQLFVNTGSYTFKKTTTGYALWITTSSGNFYKGLEDAAVGVQLAFHPDGDTVYAYINGVLETKTADGERIYRFDFETNYDIDSDHRLCITNSDIEGITEADVWVGLETTFSFLHWTTSLTDNFIPDATDGLLGKYLLPISASGNSQEQLTLHFGDNLDNLWRRSRSYVKAPRYKTYDVNVPLTYETDQYEKDPVTGSIFTMVDGNIVYHLKHQAGDPVVDEHGAVVYKYQVGDVVLDENEQPISDYASTTGREMDFLVVDARYLFANDPATIAYVDEIDTTLTRWITDTIASIEDRLLDQTQIYFYPRTTLGVIQVQIENAEEDYLDAEQRFEVDLYVKYSIYADETIRDILKTTTIKVLDSYISREIINMTEIRDALKSYYGDAVSAFNVYGLGGDKNYQVVRIPSNKNKLCLKKNLIIQEDKTMFVEDAVTVSFKVVD